MKKHLILLLSALFLIASCSSSEGPYNESADARADIQQALVKSANEQKPTVIIFGANWCPDCRALNDHITAGPNAAQIASEYIIVKVNIGNFDTNLDISDDYGNPIQGGIPGAALLSPDGTLVYSTKPGELATARQSSEDGFYTWLQKHLS